MFTINSLVDIFISQFEKHKTKNIHIDKDLSSDLPEILGSRKTLLKVFSFLMENAVEAINEEGLIKVKTSFNGNKPLRDSENQYITIEFMDNGSGIKEEHLPMVFDPFFTTKMAEYKTGLGLSLGYSIIEDHRGWMEIESKPDKGTSVMIYLPAVKKS